jgi:hypothetical protein
MATAKNQDKEIKTQPCQRSSEQAKIKQSSHTEQVLLRKQMLSNIKAHWC